ncbi:MAG: SIR2 family protein [Candidatus Loosdrechtia sp.]|uniref:SIR2 family protein n=1 Tax=Candidatus Loosdrechtia sp. TaxID=3101272 RepID=UPI003A79DAA9|nr:MAG: SIR2 family protein [Candidatus Jettenia sp. AMX2]
MTTLKDALFDGIQNRTLTDSQKTEWNAVVGNLQNGADLENALNSVNDQDLLKTLTDITSSFIADLDKQFAYQIAQGLAKWPATGLLKKLVETLPEGDRILHVLTPNYDMLFEYACDFAGISYTNGLFGGIERKKDWKAVDRALLEPEQICQGRKMKTVYRHKKHVRLYKVHGSLNYFFHRNSVIENNAWMWNPPNFVSRVMITPGISKYQTLQRYRQELLQSADAAIDKTTHFLFLGYGFNDSHLEEYIKRKLITQSCHGLIVTKDSNSRIDSLLSQSDNLWLICKEDNNTKIYNKKYSGNLILLGQKLWDIHEFTNRILGG